jgi:hypothetical protein
VRTLVVGAGILAAVALAWWALSWATGLQPLAVGAGSFAPVGVTALPGTNGPNDTGPAVYQWRHGGRIVVALYLHNSASVPVTITSVDHPGSYWVGWFSGPYIGVPAARDDSIVRPFHPVHIPADGERGVSFVFRANPKACGNNGAGTTLSQDVVRIHFTALSVFSDTQYVPLGDETVEMTGPAAGTC